MKKLATSLALAVLLLPSLVMAAPPGQFYTMQGNYFITGELGVGSLTPGDCVQAGTSGLLTTTGAACGGGGGGTVLNYQSGVLQAGTHIETFQLTTATTTPYQATGTFGAAYTTPPFCTATGFGQPIGSEMPSVIDSESTTNVVIHDPGQGIGDVFNVHCVGF